MHFGTITRLTFLQRDLLGATFSPDGEHIAFCCTVDQRKDIYLVDTDGKNLQRLTNGGKAQDGGAYFDPHFHPNGKHLVCQRAEQEDDEETLQANPLSGLYRIDLKDRVGRLLTHSQCDDDPAVSPDGRHIACARWRRPDSRLIPEIFRMTWEGQGQTRLTHTSWEEQPFPARPPRNLHPSYSPDGNFIAFVSSMQGDNQYDLYRMRPDGSEIVRLTYGAGSNNTAPLWHPTSRHIVFTVWSQVANTRRYKTDLYLVDSEGSERHLLEESPTTHWLGSFSPDGRWLAFASTRHERTTDVRRNWGIFLLDMATREVHAMTDNAFQDTHPLFNPDGTALLFNSSRDGKGDLYYAEIQF